MKGVILAGGLGSRLAPVTNITNKHLLPVWDRPMIYHPIESLVRSGITDLLIVTGGNHAGHFLNVLKNGKHLGVRKLEYAYQEGEGGIADALKLARLFVGNDSVCVMLGDNIYQHIHAQAVRSFERSDKEAAIVVKEVEVPQDASRFGIAFCNGLYGRDTVVPLHIKEKPSSEEINAWRCSAAEKTCYIITGTYFYRPSVFDICDSLVPSSRGELEISDVNQHYLSQQQLQLYFTTGWWIDAGTFDSLAAATALVKNKGANHESQRL